MINKCNILFFFVHKLSGPLDDLVKTSPSFKKINPPQGYKYNKIQINKYLPVRYYLLLLVSRRLHIISIALAA